MIFNIFRIFDPTTSFFRLNWFSIIIIFFLIPFPLWIFQSRYELIFISFIKFLFNEFKILIKYSQSNLIILISLLIIILFNNLFGLFPYIFTASRHIRFCLSLSLSIWIGIIIYRIINYFNTLCSHLTPQGTPPILIPFIVIIESISLIIRPITLAIRLTANIIAGHLLISLIGSSGQSLGIIILSIILIIQILLIILEIAVAFIQSYVFTILRTLYRREI